MNVFPASRGLSRRETFLSFFRETFLSFLSLIFASSWETSASREMNVYQYIVSYFDFDVDWETLYLGHALNLFPLVIKNNY